MISMHIIQKGFIRGAYYILKLLQEYYLHVFRYTACNNIYLLERGQKRIPSKMIATTNHHRYPNLSRGLLLSFPFLVLLSNSILPASAFAPYYRGSSWKAVASTRLYAAPKKSSKKSKTSSSSKKTSTTTTTQKKSTNSAAPAPAASTPLARAEGPKTSSKPRQNIDISSLGDLTGGRPGAIIETEEELARKKEIFEELDERGYDKKTMKDYGELQEELEAEYDIDDPEAIDAATLGTWTIKDLQSRFTYEWDPEDGDPDPNELEMNQEGVRYKEGVDIDEEGIEIGYNPMFGPSSPMDERTILGAMDSYMIDEKTRDDSMLPPTFPEGDLEIGFNQDVVNFRKSLDIIETFTDTFYKDMEVPRHVAKWHGYPEVS